MSLCQIWNDAPNGCLKSQCRFTIWEYHEVSFLPRPNRFRSQKGDQSDGSCVLSYSTSADFVSLFIRFLWNQGMPIFLPFIFFSRCRNSRGCEHFGLLPSEFPNPKMNLFPATCKVLTLNCLSLFDLTLIKTCGMQQCNCWKVMWKWPDFGKVFHLVELRWWGGKILLWTNPRCEPQSPKTAETEAPQCGVQ